MSFARPGLGVGLSHRLLTPQRSAALRSAFITYRNISSSRCSHAEPLNKHASLEGPVRIRSPADTGTLTAQDEADKHTDSYKDGPSAIDKAVHLFFFTEILRGESVWKGVCTLSLMFDRDVDCRRELLQASLHHHVPVRKGSTVPPLPWRTRPAKIPERRGALHRYVTQMPSVLASRSVQLVNSVKQYVLLKLLLLKARRVKMGHAGQLNTVTSHQFH